MVPVRLAGTEVVTSLLAKLAGLSCPLPLPERLNRIRRSRSSWNPGTAPGWRLGPSFGALLQPGWGSAGILVQSIWWPPTAGNRSPVNQMQLQPMFSYNLLCEWYLTTNPTDTADWTQVGERALGRTDWRRCRKNLQDRAAVDRCEPYVVSQYCSPGVSIRAEMAV